jgi:hypothetical protein
VVDLSYDDNRREWCSPDGTRRWCSMATCGSRDEMARSRLQRERAVVLSPSRCRAELLGALPAWTRVPMHASRAAISRRACSNPNRWAVRGWGWGVR